MHAHALIDSCDGARWPDERQCTFAGVGVTRAKRRWCRIRRRWQHLGLACVRSEVHSSGVTSRLLRAILTAQSAAQPAICPTPSRPRLQLHPPRHLWGCEDARQLGMKPSSIAALTHLRPPAQRWHRWLGRQHAIRRHPRQLPLSLPGSQERRTKRDDTTDQLRSQTINSCGYPTAVQSAGSADPCTALHHPHPSCSSHAHAHFVSTRCGIKAHPVPQFLAVPV